MDFAAPRSRTCKVVLLGDAGSGKTCLLQRFMSDSYDKSTKPTIGAAFGTKTLTTDNGPVSLQIWDTAGQERYMALANLYYRNANAAIVCCDLTELSSFRRMEYWIKEVQRAEKQCKIYVCGNKADLVWDGIRNRAVTMSDLEHFKCIAIETSSKMSYNVFTLFQFIANGADITTNASNTFSPSRIILTTNATKTQKNSKKCCSE